jgi:hypothetical protein
LSNCLKCMPNDNDLPIQGFLIDIWIFLFELFCTV